MKTLVIGLVGAGPDLLFGDDRLQNLRLLMDAGCYGPLDRGMPPTGLLPGLDDEPTVPDLVARGGGRPVIVGLSPRRAVDLIGLLDESRGQFAALRRALSGAEWDYLQLDDTGLDRIRSSLGSPHDPADYCRHLDDEVGGLLELIDDETVVLVVSTRGTNRPEDGPGAFILVAPGCPIQGAVEGAHIRDIAPTLLDLGGYDRPPALTGRSLVADRPPTTPGDGGLSASDEMMVRERLHGLGYLG